MYAIKDHCLCGAESTFESRHLKSLDYAVIARSLTLKLIYSPLEKSTQCDPRE